MDFYKHTTGTTCRLCDALMSEKSCCYSHHTPHRATLLPICLVHPSCVRAINALFEPTACCRSHVTARFQHQVIAALACLALQTQVVTGEGRCVDTTMLTAIEAAYWLFVSTTSSIPRVKTCVTFYLGADCSVSSRTYFSVRTSLNTATSRYSNGEQLH